MQTFELLPTEDNLINSIKNDSLSRNEELRYFYRLIEAQDRCTSISLNGSWGSGKTFFVRQEVLLINAKNTSSKINEEKRKIIVDNIAPHEDDNSDFAIYFDAWESDNDTDPVISIIYEIVKQLGIEYIFDRTDIFKIASTFIEQIKGINVEKILRSLNSNYPLDEFRSQKSMQEEFRNFFSKILDERGDRLILFIDELDRCKPDYAVRLLEQMKHYLTSDKITVVYSINLEELQHTIKHYYGQEFDACRYLDRFFDIRLHIPVLDMEKIYSKMGLQTGYVLERVSQKMIDMYHLQIREIEKYYRQLKMTVYKKTHENKNYYDYEEKVQEFIALYIVPIIEGLCIVDTNLYYKFIRGEYAEPLIKILSEESSNRNVLNNLLNDDETYMKDQIDRSYISKEAAIKRVYDTIFNFNFKNDAMPLGEYNFSRSSKKFAINAANGMSSYGDYGL